MKVALFAVFAACVSALTDPCNKNMNCSACIAQQYCGWCSADVIYKDGAPGAQCAGFDPNGKPNPFECHGIYSTEKCISGYYCSKDLVCVQGPPGTGVPLPDCMANCSNVGVTYTCDNQTHTCHIAQPGTGVPYDQCEATCTPPPVAPTPATPSSPSNPASPNSPSNPANPNAPSPSNIQPGTEPTMTRVWRGVQINSGYTTGEFYLIITSSTFTLHSPDGKATTGKTSFPERQSNQLWVTTADNVVIKFLWQDIPNGPETANILLASGIPGSDAPQSIESAMTTNGQFVWGLSSCLPGTPCQFKPWRPSSLVGIARSLLAVEERPRTTSMALLDHCSPQTSCKTCIAQPYCGWCSTPVHYPDNSTGSNCAGFSQNGSKPFTCNGTYSTEECPTLYECDKVHQQCVESDKGTFPSIEVCQRACFPAVVYRCDTETYRCIPTAPGNGTSLPVCQQQCEKKNPMAPSSPASPANPASPSSPSNPASMPPVVPGTPPALVGVWRGVEIDNSYLVGEWLFSFGDNNCTIYRDGNLVYTAITSTSTAGWVVFNITSGPGAGKPRTAVYGLSGSSMLDFVTLAMSAPGTYEAPNFNEAMTTPSEAEFVLLKCVNSPCSFTTPTTSQKGSGLLDVLYS